MADKKNNYLGLFLKEEEAAVAVNAAVQAHDKGRLLEHQPLLI